ncbi:hypothetical protein N7499_003322 [Penicillium canescens]|uniref:PBP domain-containing protein n=1 Tax=Penicillium canescens TaxID=5083 RepID=A0AAD6I8P5_PENCN|nr:uncharacterized protein N7446_012186 [Penicillium canescens]XP_058366340.1 uncharacterized protein N7446_012232 [Penicillium canescens]KAJ6019975.1 hypothetical protein N7522_000050 [Penicillium canescens]KAJ6020023.1 hypothetical protein N7522_000098 [Penicillium canescens]KAJ6037906.1 hypothetical protein N7460_007677 [Penicillium canescens]KAJ6037957.1 hypothetical protein N7460_007728 [Penicillium canescens]KAJ6045322.1 hypothetical protein N7446_012186 [Penicillium canescens]
MTHFANTIIQQHGDIDSTPSQVFGKGNLILRIGNGGAGGVGLVEALAKDYLLLQKNQGRIEWICNHSRNTQLALLSGYVDIALTYEREQEEIAVSEGWAKNGGCIFHDQFCLVGPEHDPANVKDAMSIEEAFDRIAKTRSIFHSRDDGSATMCKEHDIWRRCHRTPWNDAPGSSSWYIKAKHNPADAISFASAAGAYTLNDRSTLLDQASRGRVRGSTVFFEPTDPFHPLMNSCYVLYTPQSSACGNEHVSMFINYLKSERGQDLIAGYGVDKAEVPFFAPVKDKIAKSSLVHRTLRDGRWMLSNQRLQKL